MSHADPPLNVSVAALQGLENNMKKWAGARMRRVRNPDFRPFIVDPLTAQSALARQNTKEAVVEKATTIACPGEHAPAPEILPLPDFLLTEESEITSSFSKSLKVMPPPGLSLPDDLPPFGSFWPGVAPPAGLSCSAGTSQGK